MKFEEDRLRHRLNQLKSDPEHPDRLFIEHIERRLKLKYEVVDANAIYSLSKVNSGLVAEFLEAANNEDFWSEGYVYCDEDPHLLWFVHQLGVRSKQMFEMIDDVIVRKQTVEGHIYSNDLDHTGALRVLVALQPESNTLRRALDYWAENWKETDDPGALAVGVLALSELDSERYYVDIAKQVDYLKQLQHSDGFWSQYAEYPDASSTGYAVWSIARVKGVDDASAQRGLEWLVKQQIGERKDGSPRYSPDILLALLAMGEGPKLAREIAENRMRILEQKLKTQRPLFVHTSPLYRGTLHVRGIHDRAIEMIRRANSEIRIASPFIDILYEDVINLKKERPELVLKIITRPKRDVTGLRERIGKNVIDLLNTATGGGVVQSELLHARMLIIDNTEALISSADLTRDQMFDEFNAGIWTSEKEAVGEAISFYENVFNMEREKGENQGT